MLSGINRHPFVRIFTKAVQRNNAFLKKLRERKCEREKEIPFKKGIVRENVQERMSWRRRESERERKC